LKPVDKTENSIRALIIAEQANPEWTSVPLEGWSHWQALNSITFAHLVTQIRNEGALLRENVSRSEFTAVDSERVAKVIWRLTQLFRGGIGRGWTTVMALSTISYQYFERLVWLQFRERLLRREFDLVHRITPLSPTMPSTLARRCAGIGVPFLMGPLNGGLPWPRGFDSVRRQEGEWLSYFRGAYKLAPGYTATRKYASAIIAGSQATLLQIPEKYRDKCVYIPENGIDPKRFSRQSEKPQIPPLRVAFVGRLVPYKGADILLEAAAPLVRQGCVIVELIGDGPQMPALTALVARENIANGVKVRGSLPHTELQNWLGTVHVLGFPSIREFGGAVVLESMALGVIPVVIDYGGPGELITSSTGFKLPLGSRQELIESYRNILTNLLQEPSKLTVMSQNARERVFRHFTWDAKARQVHEVYLWVLGRRAEKPEFGMPIGQ